MNRKCIIYLFFLIFIAYILYFFTQVNSYPICAVTKYRYSFSVVIGQNGYFNIILLILNQVEINNNNGIWTIYLVTIKSY